MPKLAQLKREGDKKNSDFFEEYLLKIYDRKEQTGIYDMVDRIRAIVIQVEHGEVLKYLMELYLMTPYRFYRGFIGDSHKCYFMKIKDDFPYLVILEPLEKSYFSKLTAIDTLYSRAKEKPNARYIGEIYQTKNLVETVKTLQSQDFRFLQPDEMVNRFLANKNFRCSEISYFTNNLIGYSEKDFLNLDELDWGEEFDLSNEEKEQLVKVDEVHRHFGLHELILGVDHLASRVLCNEREPAILEFLCMTNYYFWGAYDIVDMNSSTNISRNPNIKNELNSPAKVFTANNTPFYTKSIDNLPSPTEDFVRNFGKRMHHMAYEVIDGSREDGTKNIDYVVGELMKQNIPFLAQIIGQCKDFPDLKQIFSKSSNYSFLITEYVQRCQGFAGFFTKDNVAYLTKAAGEDEKLRKADVMD